MQYDSRVPGGTDAGNSDMPPSILKVCYEAQDTNLFSEALGRSPEFTRGEVASGEEFTWLVPTNGSGAKSPQAVATIRLNGQMVEIESQSRKGLQAMQILIEELGGKGIRLVSKCLGGGSS